MIDLKLDNSQDSGVYCGFRGKSPSNRRRNSKTTWFALLNEVNHLTLDLSGITTITLPCLQVLCSAHRTAMAGQKSLAIARKLSSGI